MPHLLELFCGTKSIGKVFGSNGWTVTSVDLEPKFDTTICCNALDLEPSMIPGRPDLIWASPPCTHYSVARTTAKTPRDLEGSDLLVQKVLDLAAHYQCPYFFENPFGLLRGRPVVQGIPMHLVDYCMYNDNGTHTHRARKRTCIWTNTDWEPARQLCRQDCAYCEDGRHPESAQRGPNGRGLGGSKTLEQLYAIPAALPREICDFMGARVGV